MDSLTHHIADTDGKQPQMLRTEVVESVLHIHAQGYGSAETNEGAIIVIVKNRGILSLHVFADADETLPTHIINLEGAKL